MLKITVPAQELWDERASEFIQIPETQLTLEHSLVSISKWEAKHHKPYLSQLESDTKTKDELIDYIRCMTLTQNVNPYVYTCLTAKNIKEINDYIDDPMTATTVTEDDKKHNSRRPITSEVIYYWMISFNIPVEFQKWHLNRLLMLIKVCNAFNAGNQGNKMSKKDLITRNAALNAARRRKLNSTG